WFGAPAARPRPAQTLLHRRPGAGFEQVAQALRRAARQLLERVRDRVELPFAGGAPEGREKLGDELREARVLDEPRDARRVVDRGGLDRRPRALAREPREIGARERLRPRDLVGLALVAVAAQDRGGRASAVGTRDVGDAPVAAVVDVAPVRDRLLERVDR